MLTTALAVWPREAAPADVAAVLAELADAQALPFDRWDRARSERARDLAGWLHSAAMWRFQDLPEAEQVATAGPGHQHVVHSLIEAYSAMRARHQAELAPFKDADGSLLGNDYDDHDETADRHTEETAAMLGLVMAVLTGEFGAPVSERPDAHSAIRSVLAAMTDPELEGGDIVEALKERLTHEGYDLSLPDEAL